MAEPAEPRRARDGSRPVASSDPDSPPSPTAATAGPAPAEPDTCRICRGEGAPAEPLFYPCKCSGSIKYVHQDCLMEWLSHSQKKHCELCKTPFRFTKLYSPSMPKSLPVHVFVGHMTRHLGAAVLVWLRALLVVTVWLCWLPYLMRSVWAFYFWISDQGLGSQSLLAYYYATADAASAAAMDQYHAAAAAAAALGRATCPASPLLAVPAATSVASELLRRPLLPDPASALNATAPGRDPITGAMLQLLAGSARVLFGSNRTAILDRLGPPPHRPSLLSDVAWLRNLTRSPAINSGVIIILEGQIITVLVIICFILVILVRDYVVQQQPEINMRAGFAAPADRPEPEQNEQNEQNEPARFEDESEDEPEDEPELEPEPRPDPPTEHVGPGPVAPPRADLADVEASQDGPEPHVAPGPQQAEPAKRQPRSASEVPESRLYHFDDPDITALARARFPPHHPSSQSGAASQIPPAGPPDMTQEQEQEMARRIVATFRFKSVSGAKAAAVASATAKEPVEFLVLWQEANKQPDRFLRLVQDRALEPMMAAWIEITQLIEMAEPGEDMHRPEHESLSSPAQRPGLAAHNAPLPEPPHPNRLRIVSFANDPENRRYTNPAQPELVSPNALATGLREEGYLSDHEEIPNAALRGKGKGKHGDSGTTTGKGKEVALDPEPQPSHHSHGKRERSPADRARDPPLPAAPAAAVPPAHRTSVSNGTQTCHPSSPLAYNNKWTFSGIPDPIVATEDGLARPDQAAASSSSSSSSSHPTGESSNLTPDPSEGHASDLDLIGPDRPESWPEQEQAESWPEQEQTESRLEQNHQQQDQPSGPAEFDHAPAEPPIEHPPPPVRPQGLLAQVAEFMFADVDAPEDDGGDGDGGPVQQPQQNPDPNAAGANVGRFANNNDNNMVIAGAINDHIHIDNGIQAADEQDPDRDDDDDGADNGDIDDMEDFDGVMELLGMRGPIAGLFQNALFCAVLVSLTIFVGVFVPYNLGRVALWITANPSAIFRALFEASKFVQDLVATAAGTVLYCGLGFAHVAAGSVGFPRDVLAEWMTAAWDLLAGASSRVFDAVVTDLMTSATEIQNFSIVSRESLRHLKAVIATAAAAAAHAAALAARGETSAITQAVVPFAREAGTSLLAGLAAIPARLADPSSWVMMSGGGNGSSNGSTGSTGGIRLLGQGQHGADTSPAAAAAAAAELASWTGADRLLAIMCGYVALFAAAALYLRRRAPLSVGQAGQEWEASVVDVLNQASGVVKVMVVISIEMLVFPLYCGLLLDAALLPLFEGATVASRLRFTYTYPLTSAFVHWFVGTGYMFHFALFVSMCRKVMRKGVLYFIRDPDDPDFHPVRDVLERSLVIQLRKILFSAFVYGALVMVCLGGVVWGLWYATPGLLPIHYSSNEPVLEFPIDLLFYNFAMPLAVRVFRPSDCLHAMYTWWFRRTARELRLTWFLFGDRRIDEEGTLVLPPGSVHREAPWWRRLFLELDDPSSERDPGSAAAVVVPRTWRDLSEGASATPREPLSPREFENLSAAKARLVRTGQLIESGRLVRAPASDQVKIQRGMRVFLDVPAPPNVDRALARRGGGLPDAPMASAGYQVVYIPPSFRTRVFLFILSIWVFAAATGVGLTVIPLAFGRLLFKVAVPTYIRTNDVYAFSLGIYVLGAACYAVAHARSLIARTTGAARAAVGGLAAAVGLDRIGRRLGRRRPRRGTVAADAPLPRLGRACLRAAGLGYAYGMILVFFPILLATLVELYILLPLHTVMHPPVLRSGGASQLDAATGGRHSVDIIQAWTLGVLYLKLAGRVLSDMYGDSRLAAAMDAVARRGPLRLDLAVLTRAFVLPALAVATVAVAGPAVVTRALISNGYLDQLLLHGGVEGAGGHMDDQVIASLIYRAAYPIASLVACSAAVLYRLMAVFNRWTVRIRDEAYLIGERLHNFGVRTSETARARAPGWVAGGNRL